MATIRVESNGGQWRVAKNGRTVSNHRKKNRAKQAAKRAASSGDQIVTQRSDGTIQGRRTVR